MSATRMLDLSATYLAREANARASASAAALRNVCEKHLLAAASWAALAHSAQGMARLRAKRLAEGSAVGGPGSIHKSPKPLD